MNESRLATLRTLMKQDGIQQLLVTSPQGIWYVTGQWVNPMDRLDALVIEADHCRLLCYMLAQAYCDGCETIVYHEESLAVELLSGMLKPGVVGVDGSLHARFLLPLTKLRQDIDFRISSCLEQARSRKDAAECGLLRRASRLTDDVFTDAFSHLTDGMSELQFAREIISAFERAGAGTFEGLPMCAFGEGSAEPHHRPGSRKLRYGDTVLVDTGMRMDGYFSDMTRTVFFHNVRNEQRDVYDIVLRANEAAIAAAHPGTLIADIDRAARRVIENASYGARFTHRTSHGLGIDFHEEPFDRAGRDMPVLPGMCFTIEPGIYVPGVFGVRIEDALIMHDDGAEVLNRFTKALTVIT